jgi:hypothetical protein
MESKDEKAIQILMQKFVEISALTKALKIMLIDEHKQKELVKIYAQCFDEDLKALKESLENLKNS